jgi:hypothetical protein
LGENKRWLAGSGLTKACSHLTAPVRVLLLFEEERVAGELGRCDDVDLELVREPSRFGRMFGFAVRKEFNLLVFPSVEVLLLVFN